MKKSFLYIPIAAAIFTFTGCQKLDLNPKDKVDAEVFFNTETDLNVYTNAFYDFLPNVTNYTEDASSDNIISLTVPDRVKGARVVPSARGTGGWDWKQLRSINYFLENYQKCPDVAAKAKYSGIAKFFRAYFYYDKVKTFGDVPFYNKALKADDPDLYKGRDSRKLVMDSVLSDINYAIANIPATVKVNEITKYTALILKARICLFEGTFRKYHNLGDHQKFLEEASSAAEELINNSPYKPFSTGGIDVAYRQLFARNDQDAVETILARDYNPTFGRHNLNYLMTSPTQGAYGVPKDLIDSYLMKDGTRFTDIPNYNTKLFYEEMQNRDPRLTQTVAGPNFTVYGETNREPVNLNITTTGYRVIKALGTRDQWATNSSYLDIILFRLGEAYLIFAEAKAELGTLTQADLDTSINKLRDRVGMPHLLLASANSSPDHYLLSFYPNVSTINQGVILEIRRERRIELFNEGLRWDDLMRWKAGKKFEKPMVGIYFPALGAYDFNNDNKVDVFLRQGTTPAAPAEATSVINVNQKVLTNVTSGNFAPLKSTTITFNEERDYYYPIPSEETTLNPKIIQNPKWIN